MFFEVERNGFGNLHYCLLANVRLLFKYRYRLEVKADHVGLLSCNYDSSLAKVGEKLYKDKKYSNTKFVFAVKRNRFGNSHYCLLANVNSLSLTTGFIH